MRTFEQNMAHGAVLFDGVHSDLLRLYRIRLAYPSIQLLSDATDALLNVVCGSEYCPQCAMIFCPFGEQLHFHHDGCPCCATDPWFEEATTEQVLERMRKYHSVGLVLG